jgi:predicted nuclease of predicted toxin-antitoxin system
VPDRLFADENIPARAIEALRDAGCDVLSVRAHAPESADDEVPRISVAQGRILLTFDRDFGELIFGQSHAAPPSVFYFRTLPVDSREVSDMVLSLLADGESINDSMVIVSRQGIRRRRFPRIRR